MLTNLFQSTLFKSLGLSAITGSITEALKIFLIYTNVSIQNVLLITIIFSYTLAYIVQRHVFSGGRFFGISLLKYCAVTLITIQLTQKLLHLLQNNRHFWLSLLSHTTSPFINFICFLVVKCIV